jgi:hypothetical protein
MKNYLWINVISFWNQMFFIFFNLLIILLFPCNCNKYVRRRSFYWSVISIQFQCPLPVLTLRVSQELRQWWLIRWSFTMRLWEALPQVLYQFYRKKMSPWGISQLPLEKESLSASLWLKNILETSVRLTMTLGYILFITGKYALTYSVHHGWSGKRFSKAGLLSYWLSKSLCFGSREPGFKEYLRT